MFKFIMSMLSLNILFGNIHLNSINMNQNFLDLRKSDEVIEFIEKNIDDDKTSDIFIKKVEKAKSIEELNDIINDINNLENTVEKSSIAIIDQENIEVKKEEVNDNSDLIKPDNDNDNVSTDDTGLLVFIDDDNINESESIDSVNPVNNVNNQTNGDEITNISSHKSVSILTDDTKINVLEYRSINSIDGVYDIYGDLENLAKSEAVLVVINLNFDTVEILEILDNIPKNIKKIYITTTSKYMIDSVSIIENSSDRIKFIDYDELTLDI